MKESVEMSAILKSGWQYQDSICLMLWHIYPFGYLWVEDFKIEILTLIRNDEDRNPDE